MKEILSVLIYSTNYNSTLRKKILENEKMNNNDLISKISKEFARKIAEVKDAFILEELKPYFKYDSKAGIVWSQKIQLRLAEYKDWKRQFEYKKEILRQKVIEDIEKLCNKYASDANFWTGVMKKDFVHTVNKRFWGIK